jgi:predicted naringenin-chalcone synthase
VRSRLRLSSISHSSGSIRIVETLPTDGLVPEQVATLNVLYNQGNMSSVTVLAVLREIQTCLKPKSAT